ncbi:MAG TPA: hypothetical protein VJM47_06465 [Nitrosospira sp.]|jgi:hypothetical protein|nr:hypothetical protein [Nitrosospira sp.]
MKTICAALLLVAMCGEAMGYDYNRSMGNERGQQGETTETLRIEEAARQREFEHKKRMQQLEHQQRMQQQENERWQRQIEAEERRLWLWMQ